MRILDRINRDGSRILIFVETKQKARQLEFMLRRDGIPTTSMHGDKTQRERDDALADFKNGRVNLMVATDVAARGLDIKEIKFVINMDMPNDPEDYVHRIGRTGRKTLEGFNEGTAISFMTQSDSRLARPLIDVLLEAQQPVPPELEAMAARGGGGGGSRWGGRGRGGGRGFGGGRGGYR